MERMVVALSLLALLGGCAGSGGPGVSGSILVEAGSDACGPDRFRSLLGKPESALKRTRLPAGARVIHPGEAVKADYLSERLNIDINADGVIEALRCG